MSEAPSFQLFAGDYLVDTIEWTAEEVGVYTRLLFAEWANGPLTFDINRLARVAGIAPKKFKKVFATIQSKFAFDDQKKMYNKRLEETREKQAKYREQQALKGKKRAEQRWGNDSHGYDSATDGLQLGYSPNIALHSSSSLDSKAAFKEKDLKAGTPPLSNPEDKIKIDKGLKKDIPDLAPQKIAELIIEVANELSLGKFTKAFEWIQKQRNMRKNEGAILHTLTRCKLADSSKYKAWNPWAYCDKIMSIENGNYNEQSSIRNHI